MVDKIDILHKLITIRIYMDTEPIKAKQLVTNWLNEIKKELKIK